MKSSMSKFGAAAALALAASLNAAPVTAAQAAKPPLGVDGKPLRTDLPDWRGVYFMVGPTVFDRESMTPKGSGAGIPGAREHPPLTPAFEAKYKKNLEAVANDTFPDPITNCGQPHGWPRIMNVPDGYEFIVKPWQVWIYTENGPGSMRIFTDGRPHLAADVIWPTYTGDSIGHWEGDTLVFDTIGIRGEDGTIVDRTGLVLSDKAHGVTRLRQVEDGLLEATVTIEDADALTKPWTITKQYKRRDGDIRVMDYACAENNRNPVDPSGKTLTLDTKGNVIDQKR